jgi:nitrite reductase/ring-hydroxylating ferredoxin subunit
MPLKHHIEGTPVEQELDAASLAPGNVKAIPFGTDTVAVANVDGIYYAFSDICTHVGCSLSEGPLTGTQIECPCHGSIFDVTNGKVIEGPANDDLKTYTVAVDGARLTVSDS